MKASPTAPRTPLTTKADRSDQRIRLIEEAVLLIRGEWPSVAFGLCERVNRETGLVITPRDALDRAIDQTADEAVRVVEALYGHDAALEVQRRAASLPEAGASPAQGGRRRRIPMLRGLSAAAGSPR